MLLPAITKDKVYRFAIRPVAQFAVVFGFFYLLLFLSGSPSRADFTTAVLGLSLLFYGAAWILTKALFWTIRAIKNGELKLVDRLIADGLWRWFK